MNAGPHTRRERGFSLLEMTVALLIGTLLTAAVISTFLVSRAGYSMRDSLDTIQNTGRIAIQVMSEDLRLAGWWGVNTQPWMISPGETLARDYGCGDGWASNVRQAIFVFNQNSTLPRPACLARANYLEGTDIVVVRHAGPQLASEDDIRKGSVYLNTGLSTGLLFEADADGRIDAGAQLTETSLQHLYPLVSHIYYVRPWSKRHGDGIPTLIRSELGGNKTVDMAIVEYVENLQVTLGRDTNGDGNVDLYSVADAAMTDQDWSEVSSLLLEILVRAPSNETSTDTEEQYTLGDIELAGAGDSYRRSLFSTTAYIRNH